ncbi:MAG: hypothetical protein L0Y71_12295 [Gemmataceae bacterium]|nr:hypothetical protein [Gemmataceae bacterium]
MSRTLGFGALMITAVLVVTDQAQGQKRDNKGTVIPATPQDYKVLERVQTVTAIIAAADAQSVRFRIETPRLVPSKNKGGGRNKNRKQYPPQVVLDSKEFELDLADGVVVKRTYVAPEYDDKGFFKVNEADAKELRSKGYIASKVEDIRSGNIAKLVLVAPKRGKDQGVGNAARSTVKAIYLLKEGVPVATPNEKKKKKK